MTEQEKLILEQEAKYARNECRKLAIEYASKLNPATAGILISEAQEIYDWLIKEL